MRSVLLGTLALASLGLLALPTRAADQDAINRAVEEGVKALKKMQDASGRWPHQQIGCTALAALALLECGVPADDPAIQKAARAVREASVTETRTYSLSLCIMFLDVLNDEGDRPFIRSMAERLLAGQNSTGGWSYYCPLQGAEETKHLDELVRQRDGDVKRDPARPSPEVRGNPPYPPEVRGQLDITNRLPAVAPAAPQTQTPLGDNSNTQFAILALWVARHHGVQVDKALGRVNERFRKTQNADGGWNYVPSPIPAPPAGPAAFLGSPPAMTSAGLLGLAVVHAASQQVALKTAAAPSNNDNGDTEQPDKQPVKRADTLKDPAVRAGLRCLGTFIGEKPGDLPNRAAPLGQGPFPAGPLPNQPFPGPPEGAWAMRRFGTHLNYTLWSIERVAVAYGLDTIGNKDWYNWGADILLAMQRADGNWTGTDSTIGQQGESINGVDTAFALLFLRRADLAPDLSKTLSGKFKDPDRVALKAVTGSNTDAPPTLESKPPEADKPEEARPSLPTPVTPIPGEGEAAQLGNELIAAPPARKEQLLEKLREGKGLAYTQALAGAIARLSGEAKNKAREALAERMSRMTVATLRDKLADEDLEIRRAAALACALKEDKTSIGRLIELLNDPEPPVVRGAYAALKSLTGQDFGPAKDASRAEHAQAVAAWKAWWKEQGNK
jgi:hypothetical protein